MTLSGITNLQTGAACWDGDNHHSTNLSINVTTTVKAFLDRGTQQVTEHGHQFSRNLLQSTGFSVGATPAVLTGHNESGQQHIFNPISTKGSAERQYKCQTASFEGTTQVSQVLETTITASYSGCSFVGLPMTVAMNGCRYTLTGEGHPVNTTTIDIVGCTPGQQITIQSSFCKILIPEQNGLSHVVSTNLNQNPHAVTLAWTVTNITHTEVGPGCVDFSGHHSANLSLTGNTLLKAYGDLGSEQVTQGGHQYSPAQRWCPAEHHIAGADAGEPGIHIAQ